MPDFEGAIHVRHSATATFYALSDLYGAGGLLRERIRLTPSFHGGRRRDTVFVEVDETLQGMHGMEIACVLIFFSFHYRHKNRS